jgi:hypothetical protein
MLSLDQTSASKAAAGCKMRTSGGHFFLGCVQGATLRTRLIHRKKQEEEMRINPSLSLRPHCL